MKMEAQRQVVPLAKAGLDFDKPTHDRKMQLIDCLDEMFSVFIQASKDCDPEKVDGFTNAFIRAKTKAHGLVGAIGN
jgi:hypothetical protein